MELNCPKVGIEKRYRVAEGSLFRGDFSSKTKVVWCALDQLLEEWLNVNYYVDELVSLQLLIKKLVL